MEIEKKVDSNSPLSVLAHGLVRLIRQWRAEISERKDLRPNLDVTRLETLLRKGEGAGLPALLVVYTVLGCEWVFRVRRPTEPDIARELDAMEANLSKPLHQALTPVQARQLIRALEPTLKKQLRAARILIPLGFFSPGSHPQWLGQEGQRPADQLAPLRKGPLPVLGPIVAGVTVGALLGDRQGHPCPGLGHEWCAALLSRKVLDHEFEGWKAKIEGLKADRKYSPTPRLWLAAQMRRDYERLIVREGMTPEDFLDRCDRDPENVFSALIERDLIFGIYQLRWR